MGFYHQKEKVEEYIQMAEGFDGQEIITVLTKYLSPESSVLEIGMGPGKDLDLLKEFYKVTGSDYSEIFIERYRNQHPKSDLMVLNAVSLETTRNFQCLYSNKVLIHLNREEIKQSIKRQAEILEPRGIVCHSFWRGDKEEHYGDLRFTYYDANQIRELFSEAFDVISIELYKEMEKNDSLYIIARKK